MSITLDKKADLAGPGIGTYEDVATVLPTDYTPLLGPTDTQRAIHGAKRYIEDNLCTTLNAGRANTVLLVCASAASSWRPPGPSSWQR
jgi:aspartate--ammonia ligase